MHKVLLSHSYFYKLDAKQWKTGMPFPPLGTLYAASCLRENGFEVSLFDTGLKDRPGELEKVLLREKPDYLVLYDDGFNYLTKMCLTAMREAAFEMIGIAKKYNCKVLVNSSDSTDHFDEYLDRGADIIILGEGEQTLLELLNKSPGFSDLENVPGICYRENNQTVHTGKRPVLKNLDTLPLPAWDLVDIDAYRTIWKKHRRPFALNIATTRGCPFHCNWCAKPIYGQRYNSRSPGKVVEEIEMLVRNYGVDRFWITDDIFGLKPGWVPLFRDELKKKNLQIKYKIQSRADLLQDDDIIDALHDSGLEEVWIGAESGSQKILDAMDKGITIGQIEQATKKLQAKGIRVAYFLQFGYLGETKEDINATIDMVLDFMPDDIGISVSYPLPGTKFYDKVASQLGEKANWTDSDDLALLFKNTFNGAYYKTLHRYVHKAFRYHQAKKLLENNGAAFSEKWKAMAKMAYYFPFLIAYSGKLNKLSNVN